MMTKIIIFALLDACSFFLGALYSYGTLQSGEYRMATFACIIVGLQLSAFVFSLNRIYKHAFVINNKGIKHESIY